MSEDVAAEESYPPFHREEVRRQVHRALSLHVLTDGHESDERRHYFDLALNRVRSASTHNVFPRFLEPEREVDEDPRCRLRLAVVVGLLPT